MDENHNITYQRRNRFLSEFTSELKSNELFLFSLILNNLFGIVLCLNNVDKK